MPQTPLQQMLQHWPRCAHSLTAGSPAAHMDMTVKTTLDWLLGAKMEVTHVVLYTYHARTEADR